MKSLSPAQVDDLLFRLMRQMRVHEETGSVKPHDAVLIFRLNNVESLIIKTDICRMALSSSVPHGSSWDRGSASGPF